MVVFVDKNQFYVISQEDIDVYHMCCTLETALSREISKQCRKRSGNFQGTPLSTLIKRNIGVNACKVNTDL